MFGYVRPAFNELKIKDYGRFKACYCGICHELGKNFSHLARFFLNYDFVFLAMLLWHDERSPDLTMKRCAVSLKKRCVCCGSETLTFSSAMSVILAYRKLEDSINDDIGIKALKARCGKFFLKSSYKKAAAVCREFDLSVQKNLALLNELEKNGENSLDRAADAFASLLSDASCCEKKEEQRRIVKYLLYHLGRIIYILDAVQDVEEDMRDKRYNPVAMRFALQESKLSEENKETIRITLENSHSSIISAFELLPRSYWQGVLENIIYMGIPAVCEEVLNGTFENTKERISRDAFLIRNGEKI